MLDWVPRARVVKRDVLMLFSAANSWLRNKVRVARARQDPKVDIQPALPPLQLQTLVNLVGTRRPVAIRWGHRHFAQPA